MDKPHIADAPGLAWRPRKNAWAAVWLARQDLAKNGFKPSTAQLCVFTDQPTEAQADDIRLSCIRLQREMFAFGNKQPKVFAGTVRALINAFQTDPDSPYQTMRYKTRADTDMYLRRLDAKYGDLKLADLGAREMKRWYKDARNGKNGRDIIRTAHSTMTVVRMVISFGRIFEIEKTPRDRMSECSRLKLILSEERFENGKSRTESLTLRQCEDIIAAAHLPSIALAQALQFDLRARQKDIIGEWVPVSEPGISVIDHYHGRKWLRGLRWEEISGTMRLEHPISKSRTGKMLERDLTLYPMVVRELEKVPPEKRTGPVLICEFTGRPWAANTFREHWREAATKAGVPKSVFNMDSRAGGITETIEATGGNLEAARKEAEHSDVKTTMIYSRRKHEANKDTAAKVLDFRGKTSKRVNNAG